MPEPFMLQIFVVDGVPDGLRLVEHSNWLGKAIIFPRAIYTDVRSRDEFNQTGVYLLLGPRETGEGEMLYIGRGDPVRPRLERHYAKKDFWTRAVFFVAPGRLEAADIQFLESRLVNLARTANRVMLDNVNIPNEPTLNEPKRTVNEVFLQNILDILPVLGFHAFEQPTVPGGDGETIILHCREATGYDTPQGFVVQAHSLAAGNETLAVRQNVIELREDLVTREVLIPDGENLRFTQDYTFTAPSLASTVVLGFPSNGRKVWKDANGRTLREIQESQTENITNPDEDTQ